MSFTTSHIRIFSETSLATDMANNDIHGFTEIDIDAMSAGIDDANVPVSAPGADLMKPRTHGPVFIALPSQSGRLLTYE